MVALTTNRNTKQRQNADLEIGVAANIQIFAGSMVAVNSSGFLAPATTATDIKVIGRASRQIDNRDGANGDQTLRVERDIYAFANSSGGDEITVSDIGDTCYVVDDQTVAKTDGVSTRSVAGRVVDVDIDGVWVNFG